MSVKGDMIVVHSMDRFARSLKDLVTEVDQLVKRGAAIQFVKENITFTAQATPMDNLMLQLADYRINCKLTGIPVSKFTSHLLLLVGHHFQLKLGISLTGYTNVNGFDVNEIKPKR